MWIETIDGRLINMDRVEIITAYGDTQSNLFAPSTIGLGIVNQTVTELRRLLNGVPTEEYKHQGGQATQSRVNEAEPVRTFPI